MKNLRCLFNQHWPGEKLSEEQGSVLVISLMVLVVLALLGAIASNMSITEMQSAGNERRYNQLFYLADSGWQVAPNFLDNSSDPPQPDPVCGGQIVACGTTMVDGIPYTYSVTEVIPPPGFSRVPGREGLDPTTPVHQYRVIATADGRQTIQVILNKPYPIP